MAGSTDKDPKDTPNRAFNKLAWCHFYGTEGVLRVLSILDNSTLYNTKLIIHYHHRSLGTRTSQGCTAAWSRTWLYYATAHVKEWR